MANTYFLTIFPGTNMPKRFEAMYFSNFLRSLRKGNEYFKLIEPDSYYENYKRYAEHLLKKSEIRMAILDDDNDIALGWSLVEGDRLHYVFVQPEQRGCGIASKLMPLTALKSFSHITNLWLPIWNSKYDEMKFNPF